MSRAFTSAAQRIMVALDVDELEQVKKIAEELQGMGVTFKIGNQLGTYESWKTAVEFAHSYDSQIFCDTKFKDIPTTVERSSKAITRRQPEFFTIMADNNLEALKAAVKGVEAAVQEFGLTERPIVLGVTVLTSLNEQDTREIYGGVPTDKVQQFARNAAKAGLDGIVCSAQEVGRIKNDPETKDLLLVTPGIRPKWATPNDQSRIITPSQAIQAGSDYLVIGRPITQPPQGVGSPREAALRIIRELEEMH